MCLVFSLILMYVALSSEMDDLYFHLLDTHFLLDFCHFPW